MSIRSCGRSVIPPHDSLSVPIARPALADLVLVAAPLLRAQHQLLLMAGGAPAAAILDEGIEIVAAIIVGDLVARMDRLDRGNQDLAFLDISLGVRPAGVVDVARDVLAARSIDGPTGVDLEQILGVKLVRDLVGQHAAGIADYEASFADQLGGEKAKACFGTTDTERPTRG